MTAPWKPNRHPDSYTDHAIRRTTLFAALQEINSDLPIQEVVSLARDNITRKWEAMQTDRKQEVLREKQI